MATLVPVKLDGGTTIYIEGAASASIPGRDIIQEASAIDSAVKALETAEQLAGSIKSFCASIVQSLNELGGASRPAKTTVEFGLSVSAEGNVYVVKTTGEASIKITAEWTTDAKDAKS